MKVENYTIPDGHERKLIEWMKRNREGFSTRDLMQEIEARAAYAADVKLKRVAERLADRLVQREKNAGRLENISTSGRAMWVWV